MNREYKIVEVENYYNGTSEDYTRTVRLESPCRIDVTSQYAMDNFNDHIDHIKDRFKVSIEEPLPIAKDRGVMYVVFLDKHKLKDSENIQWIQI